MRALMRHMIGIAVLVALAMMLFVGCGDDDDEDAPTTTESTTEAVETTTTDGAEPAVSPEEVAIQVNEATTNCDATALEALLDPDVVLTIDFQEDQTTMTGSAAVIAAYEQPWEPGCPGPGTDFEVVSVEGNTVTTAETATLPDGTMIRPSQVFEVSDDGMVVAIQWLEGPVVTGDG